MKRAIILLAVIILLPLIGEAAPTGINTCVVLSNDTTKVLGPSPCDANSSPPGVVIDTGDARYTAYLALLPSTLKATVDGLLQTGVNMTFSNPSNSGSSDHYAATDDAIRGYLDAHHDQSTLHGANAISVCTAPKKAVAEPCHGNPHASGNSHSMGKAAFQDLYDAVKAYYVAVIAARDAAVANGTAPVWPSPAATSTH